MLSAILFGLLAAMGCAFAIVWRRQQRRIDELRKSRDKIVLEETRVFDFLRGIGSALTDQTRPTDLHVLIVEGALRILESQAGALYLAERAGEVLRPAFVSRKCPPFFPLPEEVRAGTGSDEVHSFLRRQSVRVGEGMLGAVWRDGETVLLRGEDARFREMAGGTMTATSAMLSPLIYAQKNLGLLAIARGDGAEQFSLGDFAIFKAIAEQSAFALHNATIFSEAAEKKRLDQDLQIAHEVQRLLLPRAEPVLDGYEISGINIPARQVSGDYYGYLDVDAYSIGVAIADVSGKGVPASLIMAMCRSVLRAEATGQSSAAHVLRQVNGQLFPDIKEDMFISMAYVILQKNSGQVTLCRAGHDAPLLYTARDGRVVKINPPGMALGIDSGGVFNRVTADFSLALERDDCLILYTDGITEALDSQGEEFGMEKVITAIQQKALNGASAIITEVTDQLRAFVGGQPQADDITLIVIRKK